MKKPNFLYCIFLFALIIATSSCHRKTVPAASSSARNNTETNNNKSYNNSTEIDVSSMQQDILFYINKHRKAAGLGELQLLNIASVEAAKHSANMAAKRTPFGHTGFEARVAAISKYLGSVSAAAENVADGKLTAQQVVDGWLHSPGHLKNIEGNYTLTGIGMARDAGGVVYFTQIFVRK